MLCMPTTSKTILPSLTTCYMHMYMCMYMYMYCTCMLEDWPRACRHGALMYVLYRRQAIGTQLHKAAAQGKLRRVAKLNNANYRDKVSTSHAPSSGVHVLCR